MKTKTMIVECGSKKMSIVLSKICFIELDGKNVVINYDNLFKNQVIMNSVKSADELFKQLVEAI